MIPTLTHTASGLHPIEPSIQSHSYKTVSTKERGAAAAAAAAKSLQSCPTLCDPIDGSPPGSPVSGILQARVLEWGASAFSALSLTGIYIVYT